MRGMLGLSQHPPTLTHPPVPWPTSRATKPAEDVRVDRQPTLDDAGSQHKRGVVWPTIVREVSSAVTSICEVARLWGERKGGRLVGNTWVS